MSKSLIIIGAGMGGLSAGIFGQMNGFQTQIFEMHSKPGGQCTSWKRQGYTFDPVVHHFFGCKPGSSTNQMWSELGAMPRELVKVEDCTSVVSPDGKLFRDYYDPEMLEKTLMEISPGDRRAIKEYVNAIKTASRKKFSEVINSGSLWEMIRHLPSLLLIGKYSSQNMGDYAKRFSDPFLQKAFSLIAYSNPEIPFFFHLLRHEAGMSRDILWPVGAGEGLSRSMEKRYLALGGKVHYNSPVKKILTDSGKAIGVKLEDGSEHSSDYVISNADGRKTIFEMLEGKYINETVKEYCKPPRDITPFAVDVFLGVSRDLSKEPSALIILLEKPMEFGGGTHESIELQTYGFDKTMAPPGKGVIKVELSASYSYWKKVYSESREKYREEKEAVARRVIEILEGHFPGIKEQVEVVDVTTLMTWERYMEGSQGWFNFPNRGMDFNLKEDLNDKKFRFTLPGLANFYFVGVWATNMGALPSNALSGKTVIRRICRQEGKEFVSSC